jgi:hypothetical protein
MSPLLRNYLLTKQRDYDEKKYYLFVTPALYGWGEGSDPVE